MASSPIIFQILEQTPHFRAAAPRRTSSFSSSNSWDSCFFESSPLISFNEEYPAPLNFTGIPFSWEQTPGIPKMNHHGVKKREPSGRRLLPLPPAGTTANKKTHINQEAKRQQTRDPFLAALVECSKDDDPDYDDRHAAGGGFKINRFGLSISCKRSCPVSESIVYLPRASPHYLLHPRRHRSS